MSVARILATFPRLNETTAGDGDLASAPEDLLAGSGLDRQPLSHRACADIGRAVCVPETPGAAPGTYQKILLPHHEPPAASCLDQSGQLEGGYPRKPVNEGGDASDTIPCLR